jgi:hypothetical protein
MGKKSPVTIGQEAAWVRNPFWTWQKKERPCPCCKSTPSCSKCSYNYREKRCSRFHKPNYIRVITTLPPKSIIKIIAKSIFFFWPLFLVFLILVFVVHTPLLLLFVAAQLTPWRRVLMKKLTVTQLVKKFPAFYGTRRIINVFTRACHWSLSSPRWIQWTPSDPIYVASIIILSSHLHIGLPSGLSPLGFPTKILYVFIISPMRPTCPPISYSLICLP